MDLRMHMLTVKKHITSNQTLYLQIFSTLCSVVQKDMFSLFTCEVWVTLSSCQPLCLLLVLTESKYIVRALKHLSFDQQSWVQHLIHTDHSFWEYGVWTGALKHLSTYVICHLQGPCAPTPKLEPNIYHPLVKILFLKGFLKVFLVSLFLFAVSLSLHFISNPSCGNWFVSVGERQIATPLNPKLASLICSVCNLPQPKGLASICFSLCFCIAQTEYWFYWENLVARFKKSII